MSDQAPPPPPPPGDRRSAKADTKAAKAREKAMRPWFKKKRFMLPLVLLVLIVVGVGLSGGGEDDGDTDVASDDSGESEGNSNVESNSGNQDNPPPDDVTSIDCITDETGGWMKADVHVTNHSSGRSDYFIEVVFENSDGTQQLESSSAFVQGLEPDQSTTAEAVTLTEPPAEGFSCRVTEVDRLAA